MCSLEMVNIRSTAKFEIGRSNYFPAVSSIACSRPKATRPMDMLTLRVHPNHWRVALVRGVIRPTVELFS